jgi:hypothetical protein
MEPRFWPYPILKPEAEWDDFDRHYIDFMRTAFVEGYHPRDYSETCLEVGGSEGRFASLVFRGKSNGWEPFLGDAGHSVKLGPHYGLPLGEDACVCVRPPFQSAAYLALEWMRGRSLDSLLRDFEFVGGFPSGIVLHTSENSPS